MVVNAENKGKTMTCNGREMKVENVKEFHWVVAPDFELEVSKTEEPIHVVILARNEASVIGGTLLALTIGSGPLMSGSRVID